MSDTTHEAPERIWTCNETNNIWIPIEQDDTTEYIRADRIKELEAKLAKAVEFINHVADGQSKDYTNNCDLARTTLAKLKGQDDE